MGRMFGHGVLLFLLSLCAVQIIGTSCSDDCLQWSTAPVQTHDQVPGSPDAQTESDQGEGELEELALAHGEAFRTIHSERIYVLDHTSRPRTNFVSDWFRPPAL